MTSPPISSLIGQRHDLLMRTLARRRAFAWARLDVEFYFYLDLQARRMDSEVQRDGRVLDLTDDAWREDRLPYEDVTIPLSELPEAEQDNGGSTESVKEQEMKWSDLALQSLHENTPSTGT
ncbi:hypothetical protein AMELA_G00208090 [Ameiurus melas]|uniref:Anaphase-promoting complex subunit 13 n=7 Tax=Characiphysae TaxID=186628 RepID=A0A7J6A3J3_AMEME|nr:hypothetical protein AMELA_G00208090 [Ameiurus melas]